MSTKTERENLARYLVNERRRVDMMLNEQCDPFDDWEGASEQYRGNARGWAGKILAGEIQ